jgi:NADH-quinone oxidoreductase subunit J
MALFFYLFAILIIISSVMVIISKNAVHSVLWLIFAFCNGSGLMLLLGAEFLAMMLIIIYVGAVAILFLFVVMMLDLHVAEPIFNRKRNIFFGIIIAMIMFSDLVLIILLSTKSIDLDQNSSSFYKIPSNIDNVTAIGNVLYTDFILPFQTAGLILFVAMIACITLTISPKIGIKRQNSAKQLAKNKDNCLSKSKPLINYGIDDINYDL